MRVCGSVLSSSSVCPLVGILILFTHTVCVVGLEVIRTVATVLYLVQYCSKSQPGHRQTLRSTQADTHQVDKVHVKDKVRNMTYMYLITSYELTSHIHNIMYPCNMSIVRVCPPHIFRPRQQPAVRYGELEQELEECVSLL